MPQIGLNVIETFRKLEDEMEADERLREDGDSVVIYMELLTKLEDVILEYVDDVLGELIGVSFSSLHGGLQSPLSHIGCILFVAVKMSLEDMTDASELCLFSALFKVAYDHVIDNNTSDTNHMLFLTLLVCEMVHNLRNFHEKKFFKFDISQSSLLIKRLFAVISNQSGVENLQ